MTGFDRRPPARPIQAPRNTLYCSFCGKSHHEVFHLISGPTCFICDECVALSAGIIDQARKAQREATPNPKTGGPPPDVPPRP
jgi:hypothetical protein